MPAGNDERRPTGAASSSLARHVQDCTDRGQKPVIVGGVVEVDLSRHVDRAGLVMDHARFAIHGALADCPAGVDVRLRLGRANYVYDDVLDTLASMAEHARSIEVVGTDARGVALVVRGLRELVIIR